MPCVTLMERCEYLYFLLTYGGSINPVTLIHLPTQLASGFWPSTSRPSDQMLTLAMFPFHGPKFMNI